MKLGSFFYATFLPIVSITAYSCQSDAPAPSPTAGFEIRIDPKDTLYVYEDMGANTPVSLFNAVIQNIAVVNTGNEKITIEKVWIDAIKDGRSIQRVDLKDSAMIATSKMLNTFQEQGILDLYDFQFRTGKYLRGKSFSGTNILAKDQALAGVYTPLLFTELPDSLKVSVQATDSLGNKLFAAKGLQVINHFSKNAYDFPLKGRWAVLGAPSFTSHHRWGTIQEFAFDFVKIGAEGTTHAGKGDQLEQYYGYGEKVYSVGDGTVVAMLDGAAESDQNLKQPEETEQEYLSRVALQQQQLLQKGFSHILGNYVIIRHDHNEYSYYVHLQTGSITVKLNEQVKKGRHIGNLGHSGNSTEPHLHFHLSNSPDPQYSRSIPIEFDNILLWPDHSDRIRHITYGQTVVAEN